jgi:hypothetical protein
LGNNPQTRDHRKSEKMGKISRCSVCGKFLDSKKELKDHIEKNHRITNSKISAGITKHAAFSSSKKSTNYDKKNDRVKTRLHQTS